MPRPSQVWQVLDPPREHLMPSTARLERPKVLRLVLHARAGGAHQGHWHVLAALPCQRPLLDRILCCCHLKILLSFLSFCPFPFLSILIYSNSYFRAREGDIKKASICWFTPLCLTPARTEAGPRSKAEAEPGNRECTSSLPTEPSPPLPPPLAHQGAEQESEP